MQIRLPYLATAVVLCLVILPRPAGAQGCGPCAPLVGTAPTGGTRTVWISSETGVDRGIIFSSFQELNMGLSDLRGAVEYVLTDSTSADVIVRVADVVDPTRPDVAANTLNGGNGRGYITIKRSYLDGAHSLLIWSIALHEGGHTLAFRDQNNSGCTALTTMMKNPLSVNGPYSTNGVTSGDHCAADQAWGGNESPVVINLAGSAIRLSSAEDGVRFDIAARGVPDLVAWPSDPSTGFLALDRNENGIIDDGSEFFGNHTPLPDGRVAIHGYEALATYDDNGDGWIDEADAVFSFLKVWVDAQRDGVTQLGELIPLEAAGVARVSVDYRDAWRTDRWGNEFRYRARVLPTRDGRAQYSWDVFLVVISSCSASGQ